MGLITLFSGWQDRNRSNPAGRNQDECRDCGSRYFDQGAYKGASDAEPFRRHRRDQVLDLQEETFAEAFVRRSTARIAGQEASGRLVIEIPKVNCDTEFAATMAALRIRCFRLIYRDAPL
jgi:hypothetical protein